MRVQFDATFDEYVDVTLRAGRRSKAIRRLRWSTLIFASVCAGLFVGGLVYVLIPQFVDFRFAFALEAGGLVAFAYAMAYPRAQRKLVRKTVRQHMREALGPGDCFPVVVELLPDGLDIKTTFAQIKYSWNQIGSIDATPEVEVSTRQGQLALVVRDRAFASPDEKARFIQLASSFIEKEKDLEIQGESK